MFDLFNFIQNPNPDSVSDSAEQWLKQLAGPTIIHQKGIDTSRTRVICTLLHGNEPSGIKAIHRWIKSGKTPTTNAVFIIPSVAAALYGELYEHRVIPGERDLNRCFQAPYETDNQGKLAHGILEVLTHYQPEAVIDMHNTSGNGPAFAVSISDDEKHLALTSLFTEHLIITPLKLGALMEISEFLYPTITLECGGRLEQASHQVAYDGIQHYLSVENIFDTAQTNNIEVFHNPFRLELNPECSIAYAEQAQTDATLTLPSNIEQLNLGVTSENTFLGWVNSNELSDVFLMDTDAKSETLSKTLKICDQQLITKSALKLFMITTNPKIAKMDCLCYFVPQN